MLLNNDERSFILTVNKPRLIKEVATALIDHGYDIKIIDLVGDRSNVGCNVLKGLKTEEDFTEFARGLVESTIYCEKDLFWQNAAIPVISALIYMDYMNAKYTGSSKGATLHGLKALYNELDIKQNLSYLSTTLDDYFELLEEEYPGNFASRNWRSFRCTTDKTGANIISVLNAAIRRILLEKPANLSVEPEPFDFRELGRRKTALFIINSATSRIMDIYINLVYKQIITELLDEAEHDPEQTLKVPVQLIFDDFACSAPIADFDNYVSIFRAYGISAIILLQSESQLHTIYQEKAISIIDNCDSYVYLGGNNMRTCESISRRINRPLQKIMEMPPDRVIIMRRGMAPVITNRYRTYEDPNYIKYCERSITHER